MSRSTSSWREKERKGVCLYKGRSEKKEERKPSVAPPVFWESLKRKKKEGFGRTFELSRK